MHASTLASISTLWLWLASLIADLRRGRTPLCWTPGELSERLGSTVGQLASAMGRAPCQATLVAPPAGLGQGCEPWRARARKSRRRLRYAAPGDLPRERAAPPR